MSVFTATPQTLAGNGSTAWVPVGRSPLKSAQLLDDSGTFAGSWSVEVTNDEAETPVVHLSGTEADLPALENITLDAGFVRLTVASHTAGTIKVVWGQLS